MKPPEVFLQSHDEHSSVRFSNPVLLTEGVLVRYGVDTERDELSSQESKDGGRTWGKLKRECELLDDTYTVVPLLDHEREVHLLSMVGRGQGRKIAVDRFIDVWHQRTVEGRSQWLEPNIVYEGYCGAIMDFKQLEGGRLVAPFAWWVPNRPVAPPIGANLCTVFFSDDGGSHWTKSTSDISSPCYPDFVGNNYGADEPSVIELRDGRLWMLMRTQTGFLYESFSEDQGETWCEGQPSRFTSSSSPPVLWRMPDGRILLLWNNCESPPAHEGKGVYVNRDALHAAMSEDEGETWRGFREVYRDPLENETPPHSDHGSAYPTVPVMIDGRIVFLTGQGKGRRNLVSLDPRWLTLTHHEDDLSEGLNGWIAFKSVGLPERYIRPRTTGPELVEHPSKPDCKVLWLRKPDEHAPDGALWNFPNGVQGRLKLRLFLREGCQGGSISLCDRSFKPTDDHAERLAIFTMAIEPYGGILGNGGVLGKGWIALDEWHTLEFAWTLEEGRCLVSLNGQDLLLLDQRNPTGNGLSYLHLRSKAKTVDAGYLIESVSVDIEDPVAPPLSGNEKKDFLKRYIPSYYTPPAERMKDASEQLSTGKFATTFEEELEYAPAPVDNPLKGLVPYAGEHRERFPHSMEFNYIPLSSLVKGERQYDWEPLERLLNEIKGRGHQTVFRVFLEYPGREDVIPDYLVRGGLKVARYVNTNTQPFKTAFVETPDYSDPNLRICLRDFIAALGDRYDGDCRIGFIPAGLLGTWGEWHTYPRNDLWASKEVQTEVMDAYEAAFQVTPILLRYPAGDDDPVYALNAARHLGYHDDSFAWATLETGRPTDSWFFLAKMKKAGPLAMVKWVRFPIGGEIRPEAWGVVFDLDPEDERIQDFERCVEETHVSWLMDTGMFREEPSSARRQRAEDAVRRMGYELHAIRVGVEEKGDSLLEVTLEIENRGVAPFYYDWPGFLGLLSQEGKVAKTFPVECEWKGILPGRGPKILKGTVGMEGLQQGTYVLAFGVPNPMEGGHPLRFANKAQDQHAAEWLSLCQIELPQGTVDSCDTTPLDIM